MKVSRQQQQRYEHIKTIDQMQMMESADFIRFIGWLYEQEAYQVSETAVGEEAGIDLMVHKDGRTIAVQCRPDYGTIGQPHVRDLYGAMFHVGAHEAHLVTIGAFSQQADVWAADKPITLVDGHDLMAWVNQKQPQPAEGVQNERSWMVWATAGGVALLTVCALMIGGAYWFLQQRTGGGDNGGLVQVPTRVGEDENSEGVTPLPEFAPTVTLPAGAGTAEANIQAIRLESGPVIDGRLDEWQGLPLATESAYLVYKKEDWNGTSDLTAAWWLGWDSANLYVAVEVVDDQHVQTQTGNLTYLGDSLEMQIDTDRAGDFQSTTLSPDDFQLVLSPGNFANLTAEVFRFRGTDEGQMPDNPGHSIQVASQRTTTGYWLEAAIPWGDLSVTPQPNMVLGLNLNANDNDTADTAAQEVMMSNVSTRTFRNPATWGTVTLNP